MLLPSMIMGGSASCLGLVAFFGCVPCCSSTRGMLECACLAVWESRQAGCTLPNRHGISAVREHARDLILRHYRLVGYQSVV